MEKKDYLVIQDSVFVGLVLAVSCILSVHYVMLLTLARW